MTAPVLRRLVIHGRVQGVGYRAFVEEEAAALGLDGWVRNRPDGTVEAVVAGPTDAVEALIAACRKGPFSARVDKVDVHAADAGALAQRRPGERFSMLPTA
jgi:acylphosphatase